MGSVLAREIRHSHRTHRTGWVIRPDGVARPAHPSPVISLLDGIRAVARSMMEVVHAQGIPITASGDRSDDAVVLADPARNR